MRRAAALLLLTACSQEPATPVTPPALSPVPAIVQPPTKQKPPKPAELTHVTIKALGMYCEESCPMAVRYAIAENASIYELGFDTSNESIFVSYDAKLGAPKEVTKPIIDAIREKAGFDPWLAKETWPADAQALVQVVSR